MTLEPPIPVLRVFDAALAKAFYVDWLGFKVDWEFQTGPRGPRYCQVSRRPVVDVIDPFGNRLSFNQPLS
jgi:catechol 2,3-dioxygenase-like lactoylglutathione lyase family enzyme